MRPSDLLKKSTQYEKFCIVGIILMVTFMTVMGIFSILLPKPTVSEYEKRELAPMPDFSLGALFAGTYLPEFEAHYADTFPWRDSFIQLGVILDDMKGFRGADDVKLYEGTSDKAPSSPVSTVPASEPDSNPGSAGSQPEPSSSVPAAPPEVPDGYVTEGCYVSGDRASYLFGGNRPVARQYAEYLTRFADRLGGSANVYNIVVPTSGDFYIPEKYRGVSQKDNIDYLYSCLGGSVTGVNAYAWLESHTHEYIYFRTDHHWTTLGAYYAYVGYCQAAGLDPVSVSTLEKRSIDNFVGTIYAYTRDARLSENPDYVDYYIVDPEATAWVTTKREPYPQQVNPYAEFASGGNAYAVFVWGDNPLFQMDTAAGTGKTCLLLKESYGNAFAPWLAANYDTVYVIDYRHYEQSVYDFVLQNNVDDVIFINNSFAANTSYHADRLNYLCNTLG